MLFRNMFLKYYNKAGDDGAAAGGAGADAGAEQQAQQAQQEQQAQQQEQKQGEQKPTDREAELLKESMGRKQRIRELEEQFKDVDVELYKSMLQERAAQQEQAQLQEQDRLKAEGKFDELLAAQKRQNESAIAQVKTQYEKELSDRTGELTKMQEQIDQQASIINTLTVNNAFANSPFIRDELVSAFSPARTQKLYGEHFDVENGNVVPYDKPRGDASRTVMVDKDGKPLTFEAAIARLVETDPDADAMKRSKHKQGAASHSNGMAAKEKAAPIKPGIGRIEAALNKQA